MSPNTLAFSSQAKYNFVISTAAQRSGETPASAPAPSSHSAQIDTRIQSTQEAKL